MNVVNIIPIYIALAEMFYLTEEIPGKVSINEAVEVAKVYWDDSAKKIVNWVLNKVLQEHDQLKEFIDNYDWNQWYSIFKKNSHESGYFFLYFFTKKSNLKPRKIKSYVVKKSVFNFKFFLVFFLIY